MKRTKYFALGLLLALAGGAFAVTGGGFPTFPTFQSVTAVSTGGGGSGAHPAFLAKSAVPAIVWQSTSGGTDQHNIQCYYNGGSLQFNCTLLNDAGAAERQWLSITRGTGVAVSGISLGNTTDNPPVTVNGQPVLKFAAGQIGTNASSCAIQTTGAGYFGAVNLASCVRNGVGDYTVSFTSALPHTALCLTTPETNSAIFIAAVAPPGGANVNLKTYTSAGAASDGPYTINLMCYGN